MTNQTQDYITLKPIAERFKEVAMSISDDETIWQLQKHATDILAYRVLSEIGYTDWK